MPAQSPRSDRKAAADPAIPTGAAPPSVKRLRSLQRLRADKFARFSLLLLVALTGALFFNMVRIFVVPVILAAVFAGLFYPLYRRLFHWTRGHKGASSLLVCLVLCLGLLLPAYGIAHLVAREAVRLYQTAGPKMNAAFDTDLPGLLQRHPLLRKLHLDKISLQPTLEQVAKKAAELLTTALNRASRETFELITNFLLTFFTMFYFFRDGPMFVSRLKYFSPLADRYEDELIRRFLSVSRATLKGTLLIAILKGTLGGLTFWGFGIDAPILWGVVMAFLSVLPIVGAWLIMYPAALILILNGNVWAGLFLFLIAAVVIGSLDNILEPILIGRDSGLHDLLVFFSILGGISVFGVMGFIIGPVITALFRTFLDIYGIEFSKQLEMVHDAPATRRGGAP